MNDDYHLNVWSSRNLVGRLWQSTIGSIGFQYDHNWISQGGFAISQTLPLRQEEYAPAELIAHRWFANLLPEGQVRSAIVRDLKIADTDFNLLRAIGGECAGALSILESHLKPSPTQNYCELTAKELLKLVQRRGQVSNWSTEKRPRFSLAGAQNKCPLLVKGEQYLLPIQGSVSSHILKFEYADIPHIPAYEMFTTMLAGSAGLRTVEIQLRQLSNTYFTLTTRYDRHTDETGNVSRLHQEDFCQALGISSREKYQTSAGPTFADCYRLLQEVSAQPHLDLERLLRWQIFNVLAGNSDGHAKNLSLLHLQNGEIHFAPSYDLICTRAVRHVDNRLALAVGDETTPGNIRPTHWINMADQCDVHPRFVTGLVLDVANRLLQNLKPTRKLFEDRYGSYPALQRIGQVVNKQCRRTMSQQD